MAKKAKKAAPKKASTALAVRPKVSRVTISDPTGALTQSPVGQLGELATVGALGLAEIKLTAKEEKILAEPVNPAEILLRPKVKDGPPEVPYLPHIVYTRWFNRAFGRTGWTTVPTAKPMKQGNLIMVPYLLYVHGVPVAQAVGEHEYWESNKQQTYGDVIESTVASALRRLAKRLGVGLEMWDKDWLQANVKGLPKGRAPQREEFIDAEPVAEPVATMDESTPITLAQWDRLKQISDKAGRDAAEVNLWLKKRYHLKALKDLPRSAYAEVCRLLEARGVLPMPGDGQ